MSANIADDILAHHATWERDPEITEIDFTYGVLYGTRKQSNKKDWHVLRNLKEKAPAGTIRVSPDNRWDCAFEIDGVKLRVTVRIGNDWWAYLAGSEYGLIEMCAAMIRACVTPSDTETGKHQFVIEDLAEIISLDAVPEDFNVSLLQRSQLEWLFFVARHFCDDLSDS